MPCKLEFNRPEQYIQYQIEPSTSGLNWTVPDKAKMEQDASQRMKRKKGTRQNNKEHDIPDRSRPC